MKMGFRWCEVVLHRLAHLVGGAGPLLDHGLVALLLGDQARVVLVLDLADLALVAVEDLVLLRRDHHVVLRDRDAGLAGEVEAQVLERVEHERRGVRAVQLHEALDHVGHVALLERPVDERRRWPGRSCSSRTSSSARSMRSLKMIRPTVVSTCSSAWRRRYSARSCSLTLPARTRARPPAPSGTRAGASPCFFSSHLPAWSRVLALLELLVVGPVGQVVGAQHHVLGGRGERLAVRRREDVVGRQHQDPRLGLGLGGQRHVHGHLVAVEVRVERVADQRVHLDRLALDQHRLEGLEAEAVERRRAVEQHRVLLDDLLEHVPDLGDHRVDHLLGRLDVLHRLALDEPGHDERLEQLEGHQLGQARLVDAQAGAGDDHRAARVVHALAEQVLPEAALLALEHVGERLERAVARPGDGPAAAAVVEQRVDGLLEHPLLVVHDDLGRAEVEQPLEPVVPVDHAAVEVVQVGGGEAAAVELDHRAQLRRDHRDRLEDHVLGLVVGVDERRHDLQALDRARLLLALGGLDLVLELRLLGVEVHLLEQVAHRLGAHAAAEVLAEAERRAEAVLQLAEERSRRRSRPWASSSGRSPRPGACARRRPRCRPRCPRCPSRRSCAAPSRASRGRRR